MLAVWVSGVLLAGKGLGCEVSEGAVATTYDRQADMRNMDCSDADLGT